ncbi:hypothetical protein PQX77_018531 [Marasmius sp. AFHP31]|nr:hypothetical protein PQX77_018531 [Marasmius sp. AFHP31]
MDGTFAPLRAFVDVLDEEDAEAYLVVDEAHTTGVYGPKGRGRVALEGLEGHPRVLARLCTFGKALSGSGALLISTPLITKYLLNYACPLVYTTALSNMAVIAAGCSFDLLEDITMEMLAKKVLSTSKAFTHTLRRRLREEGAGRDIIRVGVGVEEEEDKEKKLDDYAPIIPILTPPPTGGGGRTYSPAHDLSSHLLNKYSILARSITWPTVPKGDDRVRVCSHAAHTREQVQRLIDGIVEWARCRVEEETPKTTRARAVELSMMNMGMGILLKTNNARGSTSGSSLLHPPPPPPHQTVLENVALNKYTSKNGVPYTEAVAGPGKYEVNVKPTPCQMSTNIGSGSGQDSVCPKENCYQ